MSTSTIRESIRSFLNLNLVDQPTKYSIQNIENLDGYTRYRITYKAVDRGDIPAYLLIPDGNGQFPAVLIHHQHAGQRHFGKSEVVGIVGNPLQAFAPALAKHGFMVLAPDSICFEDRRPHTNGYEPHDHDSMAQYIEMGNRLITGDTLMRKILSDASVSLSLLKYHADVDESRIGLLGHSYGGTTVLFQAALDTRYDFAVSSGALCSYAYKREHNDALGMERIIPDFATQWDMHNLLTCIAPSPILIVPQMKILIRLMPTKSLRIVIKRSYHSFTLCRQT